MNHLREWDHLIMGLFRSRRKAIAQVTAKDAIDLVANGAVLIDVRSGVEWNTGHAEGARHISLQLVGRRSTEIPAGTDVVVICQSGHRSALAARTLARRDFTVSSVVGGTRAWKRAGGAIAARDSVGGSPANREQSSDADQVEDHHDK